MQVNLKHELQHEQARAVLDSIRETNSFLTISAKDRDIRLNRALLLVYSPLLRSILGSLPLPDSSATIIIPSISSKSFNHLEKILMEGSPDDLMMKRDDVLETIEAGLLLGVKLTNLLKDFDQLNHQEHNDNVDINICVASESGALSPAVAENCVFVNQIVNGTSVNHAQTKAPEFQIKVEPDEEYREQPSPDSFFLSTVKEEETVCVENDVHQTDKDFSHRGKVFPADETTEEEGEIRDSLEVDETLIEETLVIEPNQSEIEELLNATKNEIEKFLVVRKPKEILKGGLTDLGINKDLCDESEQSSTSLKSSTREMEKKQVEQFEESNQYRYPCNLCDYNTNVGFNIKKHMKCIHKCFYTFKCTKCLFESSSEGKYKQHSCDESSVLKTVDSRPEAKFQCTMCSFKTHMPDFIQVHMKNNHDSFYVFKCNRCEFESSRHHKLSSHQCSAPNTTSAESHLSKDSFGIPANLCMRCGRYHSTPCNHPADSVCEEPGCGKAGHVKSLHYPTTLQVYKAIQLIDSSIILELPQTGKERVVSQKKSKGPLYPCKECGYKTNKASMIKFHAIKTHQSPYLFTCNVCMFSTTDNNMFPSHRCKEELIECQQCDFTTKKMLLMKRHISTQHESQVYACGQCAYKCTTLDSFKKHQLLFCKGNPENISSSIRKAEQDLFMCDRCDYEGRDIHGLRKHKTTVHVNVSSRQGRSRSDVSPHGRSMTPPKRREAFSPAERSHSRQRNASNRSQTSSRGPTTPFPPPAVLYLEPAREEDMYPSRSPVRGQARMTTSNRSMSNRRRPEAKQRVLLCLRCGRRHAAQCKHPEDSRCSQHGCGKTGHVVTLHHPKTANDYKLIRSKVPGIAVNEPLKIK